MRRTRHNSSSSVAVAMAPSVAASGAISQNQIPVLPQSQQQNANDALTDPALLAIRYGMRNAVDLVEELIPSCATAEERKSVIKRLQDLMLKFIKDEMAYNKLSEMVNENPNVDESLENHEIIASFGKVSPASTATMQAYENSLSQKKLKKHEMYVQLMTEIVKYEQEAVNLESSQSIMTDDLDNEVIPTIDPISKVKLVDPVRNCICKHIYGRAAIVELIRKNPKFRCPTMGCSNLAYIKARDLEFDPKLTALVLNRNKQKEEDEQ